MQRRLESISVGSKTYERFQGCWISKNEIGAVVGEREYLCELWGENHAGEARSYFSE
jgi:hypothetical protein